MDVGRAHHGGDAAFREMTARPPTTAIVWSGAYGGRELRAGAGVAGPDVCVSGHRTHPDPVPVREYLGLYHDYP